MFGKPGGQSAGQSEVFERYSGQIIDPNPAKKSLDTIAGPPGLSVHNSYVMDSNIFLHTSEDEDPGFFYAPDKNINKSITPKQQVLDSNKTLKLLLEDFLQVIPFNL